VTAGHIYPATFDGAIKNRGRLVIPLGRNSNYDLVNSNETQFEKHELGEFGFVPLLEDKTRIYSISRYKNVFIGLYDQCIALNFLSAAAINNRKSSVFPLFWSYQVF
jgi:hypothetical protein